MNKTKLRLIQQQTRADSKVLSSIGRGPPLQWESQRKTPCSAVLSPSSKERGADGVQQVHEANSFCGFRYGSASTGRNAWLGSPHMERGAIRESS